MKKCTVCKRPQSLENFHKNKASADGYHYVCKDCKSEAVQQRRKDKPELFKATWYRTSYGIDLEDYNRMVDSQGGCCLICGIRTKLYVDHCHLTGKVRGLLCTNCNTGLGQFKDDISLLTAAINYLKEIEDERDEYPEPEATDFSSTY